MYVAHGGKGYFYECMIYYFLMHRYNVLILITYASNKYNILQKTLSECVHSYGENCQKNEQKQER